MAGAFAVSQCERKTLWTRERTSSLRIGTKERRHMHRRALLALPAATLLPRPARAETFPDRPVTMVVPYAPGGSADVLARVIGPAMAEQLGQPVVIEQRPGAGGNIGAAHV